MAGAIHVADKAGPAAPADIAAGQRQRGERSVAPSGGPFPPGCNWRAVSYAGEQREVWAVREYEYWQKATAQWGPQQPQACIAPHQIATPTCAPPPSLPYGSRGAGRVFSKACTLGVQCPCCRFDCITQVKRPQQSGTKAVLMGVEALHSSRLLLQTRHFLQRTAAPAPRQELTIVSRMHVALALISRRVKAEGLAHACPA